MHLHGCVAGKGVRGGKAEAASVGTKMLDWADRKDSFHWKIAQKGERLKGGLKFCWILTAGCCAAPL